MRAGIAALDLSRAAKSSARSATVSAELTARARPRAQKSHSHVLPKEPASIPVDTPLSQLSPTVQETLSAPGWPLDSAVRASIEPRFGRAFGHVRVHDDATAAASARAVGAQAYTVGNHIAFDRGRFAPDTVSGRRLLMHELAHVTQHGDRPMPAAHELKLASPAGASEQAVDAALDRMEGFPRMPGALIGSQLAVSTPSVPLLQRAVATWGGDWDTTRYEANATNNGIKVISLKFQPKDPVDATMIGIVQKVTTKRNGAVVFQEAAPNHTIADRSIPAGSPGAGANIDQNAPFRNPLYATGAEKTPGADHLWDTPIEKWPAPIEGTTDAGQHGFHHRDAKGVLHHKDATLNDMPNVPGAGANSSQVFEDTALAVTGVQAGATYGSVQWGWQTDGTGKFSKLPLSKVSDTVPSATFKAAENLWNKNKDSAGNDLIQFHTASESFVQADNTPIVSDPADAAKSELEKLPKDTRVEVIDKGFGQKFNLANPKATWWKVTITDGPSVGKTGWVQSSQLGKTKVQAPPANAAH